MSLAVNVYFFVYSLNRVYRVLSTLKRLNVYKLPQEYFKSFFCPYKDNEITLLNDIISEKKYFIDNLAPLRLIPVSQQPTEYSMLCIWRCDIKQTHQNRKKRNKWFLTSFSSLSNILTYHTMGQNKFWSSKLIYLLCNVSRLIQVWLFC